MHEADWNKVSNNIFPFSDFISHLSEVEELASVEGICEEGGKGQTGGIFEKGGDLRGGRCEGQGDLKGLVWTRDRLWLNKEALNIADNIIPAVYSHLISSSDSF